MKPDEIDVALVAELDKVIALEREGKLESLEVIEAQRLLMEAATWMMGHRPPLTFEEAWERIEARKKADRLEASWR